MRPNWSSIDIGGTFQRALWLARNFFYYVLRQREADRTAGVVDAALGHREAAAARAVFAIQGLKRLRLLARCQDRQVDSGDLVRLGSVFEPHLVLVVDELDVGVDVQAGQRPRFDLDQRRIQHADVFLRQPSLAI